MLFVASQIAAWIVAAVIFGFLIGWLARGRGKTQSRSSKRRFR